MATEQDAVNALLIARGLTPVSSLDSGHPYVVAARNILARRSEEVQAKSWWFNTDTGVQLTRTPETWIRVPAGVIRVDNTDLVILDGLFYDPATQSITFDEDPDEMTLIYQRGWTDLSATPFNYIVALAKEEFIRPLESTVLSGQAEKDIARAYANMQIAQLENQDPQELSNPLLAKWRTKMIQR